MASHRAYSTVPGVLRGNGLDSKCLVEVEEVSMSGLPPAFGRCNVVNIAKALPDGDYVLLFNGRADKVRLVEGEVMAPLAP
jgi:hypothetical protein